MSLILAYDTETSGLPDWKQPSDGEQQPHLVQLAAQLIDTDSRKIIQSMDVIIRPEHDGTEWEIPQDVVDIHGITPNYAMMVGVPEPVALYMLMALWQRCDFRLGHVQSFDARIIRIALKRYATDEAADSWKEAPAECTGKLAKDAMGLSRQPKLVDAYQHFMGAPMPDAHSAMGDVNGCVAVYWKIMDGAA